MGYRRAGAAQLLLRLVLLPESLPPERRSERLDWSYAEPFGSLLLLKRYPQVFGLAAVVFIAQLAHYVYPSVFVLFADYQYPWGPREVSWVLAAVGVMSVAVNAGLAGCIVARLGERRTLLLGLGCGAAGFLIYGLADVGWIFLLACRSVRCGRCGRWRRRPRRRAFAEPLTSRLKCLRSGLPQNDPGGSRVCIPVA